MKKNLVLGVLIIILVVCTQSVYAFGINTDQSPTLPSGGSVIGSIKDVSKDAWATVSIIVQMVAVACVVFAGLRYMFASADQKADVKKGLTYLAIGAVLVFGAVTIINLVVNATNDIL